ncbi:uncharacterized protein LOC126322720 [Schistocerca gregaria]|uniref:uncharacterized protein LOC126322720 n=1 Tax=Schistocerca gregaria TaxID=7010 RepID=UPI00211E361E|nr:uncharacterized protein LOC126322720 [Schistocerca gregaria]
MENIAQGLYNAPDMGAPARKSSSVKEKLRRCLTDITNLANHPACKDKDSGLSVDLDLVQKFISDVISPDKSQFSISTIKHNKHNIFKQLKQYYDDQQYPEDKESILYDVDKYDYDIPVMVAPYAKQVYTFNKIRELDYYKFRDYMKIQNGIDEEMRSALVDWLVAVHDSFRLIPETLHLSIYLVDKFLSMFLIPTKYLQLVGIGSMFIASKYQEVNPPECDDFVYVCSNTYTRECIIKIEKNILESVQYDLGVPSAIHFLRRYSKIIGNNHYLHTLAKYYIELGICIYDTALWPPSALAAASLYLGRKATKKKRAWSSHLTYHSTINHQSVHKLASELLACLHSHSPFKFRHVLRKYNSESNYKVAMVELPRTIQI